MAGSKRPRDDEMPWQHEIFFSLSRMLNCRIHIGAIDGVLVLRDTSGGRDVISHRESIIRYLEKVYDGLEGLLILVAEDQGWSLLDTNRRFDTPPILPVTERTLAGALATANYLNSGGKTFSRWAH